ncbi:hypothetical protein HU200_007823 [Digitaria exilis]|uniref:Uncharacterized protein n=1 Tax=Digitaria exilis TaxID=1010633 RepID=A0A835KQV9_9POAL|nr:hypothetical protein HU200_007823 [Digitaria exilis]
MARHLLLVALAAVLAVAAPRAAAAWGGNRFFFSKTTRADPAAAEPEKPAPVDPNAAPAAFSRPSSTTTGGGRGYGLYGRPEESYPPEYFRRGVHRNAEKLTTTTAAAADVPSSTTTRAEEAAAAVPVQGGRGEKYPEDGSGRGRPATNVPTTTTTDNTEEEEAPVGVTGGGDLEGVDPYPENGSGRGRPPWYYTAFRGGRRQQGQEQRDYGMSDTRLYQNGRYYYDVDAGRYGYGRESNPMGTRPEEQEQEQQQLGSGYGRRPGGAAAGDRRGSYQQYGNGDEFGNGGMDQNQNGRYIP